MGNLFIVTVAIVGCDREVVRTLLQKVEMSSGKGIKKWTKSTQKQRLSYIQGLLAESHFNAKLFYARFSQSTDYSALVQQAISRSIVALKLTSYSATILIDGLSKNERQRVAVGLRRLRVRTEKVRGLDDENDEFIRLADALAGFIRDFLVNFKDWEESFKRLTQKGWLREV